VLTFEICFFASSLRKMTPFAAFPLVLMQEEEEEEEEGSTM
jgi:hypothetical protein